MQEVEITHCKVNADCAPEAGNGDQKSPIFEKSF